MKLILVGTDFSEGSAKAQQRATELAKATGATLHLLHVLEPVDEPDSEDPETQDFYTKLETTSREKLRKAAADISGIDLGYSTEIGHRHPTILEVAEKLDADMIVLGSNPMEPDSKRIGTSHRVAVTANRPVLLVPG